MTSITKGNHLVTLINVFTVEPADQSRLVKLLVKATDEIMKGLPGFISANIHRSIDGTRVINYAQWRRREDFEAMVKDPIAQEHMREATSMAKIEPQLYEVVKTVETDPLSGEEITD